jgi:hypothetical protein
MKKNLFWSLAILLALVGLAGCTGATMPTNGSVRATKPPKYQPSKPQASPYGEWWIDARTCTLHATATDFTITTDGKLDTPDTVYLRLSFATPLATLPVAEVTHAAMATPVEGARGTYNVRIPYTSGTAAAMLDDGAYLLIRYQPVNGATAMESSFSTRNLMFALGDMSRYCK